MRYDYSYFQTRPNQNDFDLQIISQHKDFNGKTLKQYLIDGIKTVGVYGDEKFEIHFHNRSQEDVQVRISLDGTDVLTAKPANLDINHDMWLVRAGKTLHLRAWAETNKGGASFVFTGADKSVALHAHGDLSHKGIISAAVFTDKYRPIQRIDNQKSGLTLGDRDPALSDIIKDLRRRSSDTMSYSSNISESSISNELPAAAAANLSLGLDPKREASVGAGEYVEQRTHTIKGLDNPILNTIVRVKYMWFDDLRAKINARSEDPHPTGFPGEKIKSFADLSNVPRVNTKSEPERIKSPDYLDPNIRFDDMANMYR